MPNAETLGIGPYSLSEVGRRLHTPPADHLPLGWRVRFAAQRGPKAYAPLIASDESSALTFGDLVELMYVRRFRDGGVGLDELRATAAKFCAERDTTCLFATKRFATDGRRLLIAIGGHWEHALTGEGHAFFEDVGRQLVHTGDLTS